MQLKKTSPLAARQEAMEQIDGALGIKIADMLATLGDVGLTYQTPGDGFLNLGQVFAVSIKDEVAFKKYFNTLCQKLEGFTNNGLKIKRRIYHGVELREFGTGEGDVVHPTFAVCDGWLVLGLYPQSVQGFVLRSKGKLPAWKPDARTAKTLAAIPEKPAAIQYTDPRPTVKLVLSAAQPFASNYADKFFKGYQFDTSVLPNPEEACQHLFPNVVWIHNDGKMMRWETRESLALPFELVGIEAILTLYFADTFRSVVKRSAN